MDHTARNYHAHGGSEWVVGGKLPFLPSCIRGRDEVARIFKRYAETKKEGQQ